LQIFLDNKPKHIKEDFMQSTVYVSNLSYTTTESDIQNHFSPHGEIKNIKVLTDRDTGRPRGIAFVEYTDEQGASSAIMATDRREFMGRTLSVSLARPKGATRTAGDSRPVQEPRREIRQPSYDPLSSDSPSYGAPLDWDSSWEKSSRRDRRENRRKFDR
jgi:RNA recognition motif-containing protein